MTKVASQGIKNGSWYATCPVCGGRYFATELRARPKDGLMVCSDDWEDIHPQDHIPAVVENRKTPWSQPEPSTDWEPITPYDPTSGNDYGY